MTKDNIGYSRLRSFKKTYIIFNFINYQILIDIEKNNYFDVLKYYRLI